MYFCGVSLAVWMGGVTHELDLIRRATTENTPASKGKDVAVANRWRALMQGAGVSDQRRLVIDVIAGTSAGGLNGTLLANVIAHNTTLDSIPWAHWLTPSSHSHSHDETHSNMAQLPMHLDAPKTARVELSVMPMQAYPWTMLNASASWTTTFNSSGAYAWALVRFSLSGLPRPDDLRVALDGHDLGWTPRADIGVDRWHYDIKLKKPLKEGEHALNFTLLNAKREGEAQLCSVEILEFGDESEFVTKPGHYSLYPTYALHCYLHGIAAHY